MTDETETTEADADQEARADWRRRVIAGLREVADFYEANPAVPVPMQGYVDERTPDGLGLPVTLGDELYGDDEAREVLAAFARAPGRVEKRAGSATFGLARDFQGAVRLSFSAMRSSVCERRVVGTKKVERPVIVQEAITRTETVEEDDVEWDCAPILGEKAAGAPDA